MPMPEFQLSASPEAYVWGLYLASNCWHSSGPARLTFNVPFHAGGSQSGWPDPFSLKLFFLPHSAPSTWYQAAPGWWKWASFWSQSAHEQGKWRNNASGNEGHRRQSFTWGPLLQGVVVDVFVLSAPTSVGGTECFHSSFQGKMTFYILNFEDFVPSVTWATMIS